MKIGPDKYAFILSGSRTEQGAADIETSVFYPENKTFNEAFFIESDCDIKIRANESNSTNGYYDLVIKGFSKSRATAKFKNGKYVPPSDASIEKLCLD